MMAPLYGLKLDTLPRLLGVVGLAGLVLFVGCKDKQQAEKQIPEQFTQYCISCHGQDLKGSVAQSLIDGSWQFGARKSDIFRSIKFGHPSFGMPSWGAIFNDEEIMGLADYLVANEEKSDEDDKLIPQAIETLDYMLSTEVIVEGLENPWGIVFLAEGHFLVTERPGRLRVFENGRLNSTPVVGVPEVVAGGQGGLLDVAIDPDYEQTGWVYLVLSHGIKSESDTIPLAMTSVIRGKIIDNNWSESEVIYEAPHDSYLNTRIHYGGRIAFDKKQFLYLSIGDRSLSERAQDLSQPNGKIHRLHKDGSIPKSNPFYGEKDKLWSIYSLGHRNPQGLAIHPETDKVWVAEHGPLGGDEVNQVNAGLNYGWPEISYGINYNGELISEFESMAGMEQPIWYWKPSIAVSGINFYTGDQFSKWKNQLLVSALRFEEVQLLNVKDNKVIFQQTLLKNYGRVRQVCAGPDGAIYVVFDKPGRIVKLSRQDV
ncbi:MAG: PQQ-dependent sugar dehydrogenase [Cyclobacteriaceae bacterium]